MSRMGNGTGDEATGTGKEYTKKEADTQRKYGNGTKDPKLLTKL